MEDITLKFENPIGRKRRKAKSTSKITRKRKIKTYRRRKKLGSTTIGKTRKRKVSTTTRRRRIGAVKVAEPIKTTMGRRRRKSVPKITKRRRSYKRMGSTTIGRKKGRRTSTRGLGRTLGFNLDIKGMFDELLSYATMGVGGFGGLIATSYIGEFIFSEPDKTDPNSKTLTQGDGLLAGLITFFGLNLLQDFIRPSGLVANMFTGAKMGAILSAMIRLKHILVDGLSWDSISSWTINPNTAILGDKNTAYENQRWSQSLLGGSKGLGTSYYIDDSGETFPLGANRVGIMGANRVGIMGSNGSYPSMDASQDVNRAVDSLLQGAGGNNLPVTNIAFR